MLLEVAQTWKSPAVLNSRLWNVLSMSSDRRGGTWKAHKAYHMDKKRIAFF